MNEKSIYSAEWSQSLRIIKKKMETEKRENTCIFETNINNHYKQVIPKNANDQTKTKFLHP